MAIVWCRSCLEYHEAKGAWWLAFKEHEKKVRSIRVPLLYTDEATRITEAYISARMKAGTICLTTQDSELS